MIENSDTTVEKQGLEPAQRVISYVQKGIKIYDNNPVECLISDIIDNAEMIQQYGTDRSEFVLQLHRAAQQLSVEVEKYLLP